LRLLLKDGIHQRGAGRDHGLELVLVDLLCREAEASAGIWMAVRSADSVPA
jgi:hypothetical protein